MTLASRDLVTRVLPHVPIRQWVFSLPFALRVRLAFDHRGALALWALARREIAPSLSARRSSCGHRSAAWRNRWW